MQIPCNVTNMWYFKYIVSVCPIRIITKLFYLLIYALTYRVSLYCAAFLVSLLCLLHNIIEKTRQSYAPQMLL